MFERLKELEAKATPAPWYAFHVDDDMAMNCYGVSTDPSFDRREDYIGPSDETHQRIVALTLYQSCRVVCHSSARWSEDAELIAFMRTALPALLDCVQALKETTEELKRHGWGDFHYGPQPQDPEVVAVVEKCEAALAKVGAGA